MTVQKTGGGVRHRPTPAERKLMSSPAARAAAREVISVCHKLWVRGYADGNGGNVSFRVGERLMLCTPTLVSKADLAAGDLVWIDTDGEQIAGRGRATSEIQLHLAIYRQVKAARSVVHCHPPHATAYALAGQAPPSGLLLEFELFVGPVGVAPYRTPGTPEFAEAAATLATQHNTILLCNHGMVSWADTPTHAEWLAEIVDTYCHTLAVARQLGLEPRYLAAEQIGPLRDIKERMAHPDLRRPPRQR
jgi:L-fuculose-phosphate aldolase